MLIELITYNALKYSIQRLRGLVLSIIKSANVERPPNISKSLSAKGKQ